MNVGIYGIIALFLQLVSGYLVHQTYATPLLVEIDHNALAILVYHLHGPVQLFATVTTFTAKDITGHATAMHTHQNGLVGLPCSLDESHMLQAIALLPEGNDAKTAKFCGQLCLHSTLHDGFLLETVGNEVANADNLQSMFLSHLLELWHACHGTVLVENLYESSSRLQSCQACQIHRSLCMSGSLEHAFVLGIERIDMPWTSEVHWSAGGIGQGTYGGSSVVGTYARGTPIQEVNGDCEWCTQHTGILLHLMRQFQFASSADGNGSTEHSTSVTQHKVDLLRSNHLGRSDKVALILPVFIINNNNEASLSEIFEGFLYTA